MLASSVVGSLQPSDRSYHVVHVVGSARVGLGACLQDPLLHCWGLGKAGGNTSDVLASEATSGIQDYFVRDTNAELTN